jgi:hypothetical protein
VPHVQRIAREACRHKPLFKDAETTLRGVPTGQGKSRKEKAIKVKQLGYRVTQVGCLYQSGKTIGVIRQFQVRPTTQPIAPAHALKQDTVPVILSMTSMSSLMARILPSQFQQRSLDMDPSTISRSVLERGAEHVVSYGGTSQYNREGTGAAACGLAAMNFARIVFLMEQDNLRDTHLLQTVLSRECAEVRRIRPMARLHLIFPGSHLDMCTMVWQPSS